MTPALAQLAAAHGVATTYQDWADRPVPVSPAAVVAALAALDVDASSTEAVQAALVELEQAPWRTPLPPVLVVRGGPGRLDLHVEQGAALVLEVVLEDGGRVPVDGVPVALGRRDGQVHLQVALPDLPLGWHTVEATVAGTTTSCPLVVAPERLAVPERRSWGWQVQLYALRSEQSWGVGDYADLRTVVTSARADGAGAVLVNPLHAETPVLPLNPSPYSPSSRLWRSPVGLRVEDTPEYAGAPAELRQQVSGLRPPTDPDRVLRDPCFAAKLAALELLWPRHRVGALAQFRHLHGGGLEDFALFCALAEVHGTPWQDWPEQLRHPDGPGIAAARVAHAERAAFWCWVQLLVDEQLAGLGEDMAVGVVHDLAVGVDAGGADAWALQDVLALGTTVGAPPDSFNQQGQDWGLPPWRPDRLRAAGYAPYRALVRGVLRHAGGVRIDHVMGLFRLWWVPEGSGAAEGTYVSYDAQALLAVLALEALRAGAVVVGEDLGTVEARVRTTLDDAGVLGSAVLWFETDHDGSPLPPRSWRPAALASITTHDLPTAAGFLAEEHVRLRHELDQLGHSLQTEQERVRTERERLLAMLGAEGLLSEGGGPVLAMHAALVASPCRIVLASYADAVGDLRQPNLPGTVEQYPNWQLPVADASGTPLTLEQVLACPGVRRITALLQQVR